MPYRLRITREEVEMELTKMGFQNISEEMVEAFRKDLLKLIKNDLKKIRQQREMREGLPTYQPGVVDYNKIEKTLLQPCTSTPTSYLDIEREMSNKRNAFGFSSSSDYGSGSGGTSQETSPSSGDSLSSSELSVQSSSASSKMSSRPFAEKESSKTERKDYQLTKKCDSKKKEETLPTYPEKPDPVNLYHYYKAHWTKYKVPGEDPRSALRWEIRSKLFYSS